MQLSIQNTEELAKKSPQLATDIDALFNNNESQFKKNSIAAAFNQALVEQAAEDRLIEKYEQFALSKKLEEAEFLALQAAYQEKIKRLNDAMVALNKKHSQQEAAALAGLKKKDELKTDKDPEITKGIATLSYYLQMLRTNAARLNFLRQHIRATRITHQQNLANIIRNGLQNVLVALPGLVNQNHQPVTVNMPFLALTDDNRLVPIENNSAQRSVEDRRESEIMQEENRELLAEINRRIAPTADEANLLALPSDLIQAPENATAANPNRDRLKHVRENYENIYQDELKKQEEELAKQVAAEKAANTELAKEKLIKAQIEAEKKAHRKARKVANVIPQQMNNIAFPLIALIKNNPNCIQQIKQAYDDAIDQETKKGNQVLNDRKAFIPVNHFVGKYVEQLLGGFKTLQQKMEEWDDEIFEQRAEQRMAAAAALRNAHHAKKSCDNLLELLKNNGVASHELRDIEEKMAAFYGDIPTVELDETYSAAAIRNFNKNSNY